MEGRRHDPDNAPACGLGTINGYHAHVHARRADQAPRSPAPRRGRHGRFEVSLGRWHYEPIGPYPSGSYQIVFEPDLFPELVPWLALNRQGLTVFVHPELGDALADDSAHVIWLGDSRDRTLLRSADPRRPST